MARAPQNAFEAAQQQATPTVPLHSEMAKELRSLQSVVEQIQTDTATLQQQAESTTAAKALNVAFLSELDDYAKTVQKLRQRVRELEGEQQEEPATQQVWLVHFGSADGDSRNNRYSLFSSYAEVTNYLDSRPEVGSAAPDYVFVRELQVNDQAGEKR